MNTLKREVKSYASKMKNAFSQSKQKVKQPKRRAVKKAETRLKKLEARGHSPTSRVIRRAKNKLAAREAYAATLKEREDAVRDLIEEAVDKAFG